ncbi:hypothetical protein FSBG_00082 [Fusobacterium gonidiaformans 3-1-5R]|uniref:Ribbon-helix-helix protein, CopG family n=1 Tax=Fusobacterium gonidiaformans 3-1-5R TaxID=469605 RepID=E5BEQ4_9FUSO|nr:hypothetical protein [Fusobacterium gonidiaformans]EFS20585.1 hypothetical protein FSBG_00082 [Fusobacterium gonidiaformans 3-1-5R]
MEATKKKMGRPTNNPKNIQTRIRMTEEEAKKLDFCAKTLNTSKTEIISKGVDKIYQEISNKK